MIEGTLTVNLDPPYVRFHSTESDGKEVSSHYDCTREEIRTILEALGSEVDRDWPVRDCLIRTRGSFPHDLLSTFHLIPTRLRSKAS
ncbi:MAG: hypothetical protein IPM23_12900 [Candidatus Melainabacteria bacterium]|nr:hypothetical protein [Candidatus Melainabacteria bacterium]